VESSAGFFFANMDQNTKKFCGILDKLGNQLIEIVNFYNEAEEIAEVVLESNYEDTCYHTNITINDDLTATVNQERKDNLTGKDFPPDDYYPMGIDGLSESKSWNLSKYEVSLQLSEIILPRFEEFLVKIKDGFKALQKLKLENSTSTEALGMIKNLHNVGILFVTEFKKYGLHQKFVDNLKMYFSEYCDLYLVCGRLDEFKVRMGIEPVKQKKDNKDPFAIKAKDCSHNEDFTTVIWYGTEYQFNKTQARCIKYLWKNNSASENSIGEMLDSAACLGYRLRDTFRNRTGYHCAWRKMIISAGKGCFKLNKPQS
jgi:hypothetical protein